MAKKPIRMVVRRGAIWRYNKLKQKTAELPVVVSWDRRQAQRRTSAAARDDERRKTDRRRPPSFTWDLADFVIVDEGD